MNLVTPQQTEERVNALQERIDEAEELREKLKVATSDHALGKLYRESIDASRALYDAQVFARESFENVAAAYEHARDAAFEALEAATDAVERARKLRVQLEHAWRTTERMQVDVQRPPSTSIAAARDVDLRKRWRRVIDVLGLRGDV